MRQQLAETLDDLEQFERQVDRMLYRFFPSEPRYRRHAWRPPTDVYETDDAVIVKIEVAGMHPDDFLISFEDRVLRVYGNRQDVAEKLSYHRMEIAYGEFHTEVTLGGNFVQDQIEAKYENGFLYITLPKFKHEHRVPVRVQ